MTRNMHIAHIIMEKKGVEALNYISMFIQNHTFTCCPPQIASLWPFQIHSDQVDSL